ncbi:hypothetical protein VNI00_015469 [Paramarasmius palmivorus]|uniref:G protein-coupled receptor n=1 Tax=Paramarasmius palmivorus TaxID=297713 RepID=A0AAW0BK21_9AGAR
MGLQQDPARDSYARLTMTPRLSTPALLFLTAWAQILLYGCNIVLYGVGVFFLLRRKGKIGTTCHLVAISILLALITTTAVVTTIVILAQIVPFTSSADSAFGDIALRVDLVACTAVFQPHQPGYIAISTVRSLYFYDYSDVSGTIFFSINAYAILFYRCYHIWNQKIKILIPPLIIIIAESILYWGFELPLYVKIPYVGGVDSQEYSGTLEKARHFDMATITLSIVADSLLTLLIAGRIWRVRRWLQHSGSHMGQMGGHRDYNRIIAMTLESGIINPIGLIILLVFTAIGNDQASSVLASLLPQIFAIAPLLITVRAGLGLTVEAEQGSTRTAQNQAFSLGSLPSASRVLDITASSSRSEDVELQSSYHKNHPRL